MYRFVVYGALRNEVQPSLLIPVKYTFGNNNRQTCQMWVNKLNDSLNLKVERPKSLMVCSSTGQTLGFILSFNFP